LKDRTFSVVLKFPDLKKEHKAKEFSPSRLYRNPVNLAREWQKALGNGDCSSPANLARKLGVSRARVNQILRLLRLAPEVSKAIVALGDPLPSPIVTERRLRPMVNLSAAKQKRWLQAVLRKSEGTPIDGEHGLGSP